ncbi:MAG TPA: methyltransferase domain-containing protein [Solirubrobacteraceae bacterium]|nr:methyltransferase domain-containing protein [Solirubrobacteraceae bacterium]
MELAQESETPTLDGPVAMQATLWSEHARDWADVMEGWNGWGIPLYRHVLERLEVTSGTRLLDVGCGAGRFCRMAADRGARVAGIDATAAFVDIARDRIRGGDFRVGDMQRLPWPDDCFDVVTGFNSFFIAPDMVAALREARRVARPGASIAMTVFGRPQKCQSTTIFRALGRFSSPPASNGDDGPALHEEGALDDLAARAGLRPVEAGYVEFVEEYPDLETMLRGMLAAPPFVRAAQTAGRDAVRAAVAEAAEWVRGADGRYRVLEEERYLIAVA